MAARSIGNIIDKLYELQQARLEIERQAEVAVNKIKVQEETLTAQLLKRFGNDDINGAAGLVASSSITESLVPTVTNWTATYDYIRNKGARSGPRFELLQKRIAVQAWRELNESGILVPGTKVFKNRKLSIKKLTSKSRKEPKAVAPPKRTAKGKGNRRAR